MANTQEHRAKLAKLQSYVSIVSVILGSVLIVIVFFLFHPRPNPEIALDNLNKLQEKSVEIIIETNKLIVSLSLLIIGGVGGFSLQKYPGINIRRSLERTIVIFCIALASLSIFFGYFMYRGMVEMLSNSMYDPTSVLLEWPQTFQFVCFFLAVLLFGFLVFSTLKSKSSEGETGRMEDEEEHKNEAKN
jgi:Na+/H+ antiporter NhaD/arsenite permease-like protein